MRYYKLLVGAVAAMLGTGAPAALIKLDFMGTFTGIFSTPLVPTGTSFSGFLVYDSTKAPSQIGPFDKRYNFDGPFSVTFAGQTYSGPFDAFASTSPFGPQGIGFNKPLPNNVTFTLRFNNLFGVLADNRLPDDPSKYPAQVNAGISTPMMQGNFGTGQVVASFATVPEPATWMGLLSGFIALGAVLRSRKSSRATRFYKR